MYCRYNFGVDSLLPEQSHIQVNEHLQTVLVLNQANLTIAAMRAYHHFIFQDLFAIALHGLLVWPRVAFW